MSPRQAVQDNGPFNRHKRAADAGAGESQGAGELQEARELQEAGE
jgi:hypothetical protein